MVYYICFIVTSRFDAIPAAAASRPADRRVYIICIIIIIIIIIIVIVYSSGVKRKGVIRESGAAAHGIHG